MKTKGKEIQLILTYALISTLALISFIGVLVILYK